MNCHTHAHTTTFTLRTRYPGINAQRPQQFHNQLMLLLLGWQMAIANKYWHLMATSSSSMVLKLLRNLGKIVVKRLVGERHIIRIMLPEGKNIPRFQAVGSADFPVFGFWHSFFQIASQLYGGSSWINVGNVLRSCLMFKQVLQIDGLKRVSGDYFRAIHRQ